MPEGTLRAILRQADTSPDEFLKKNNEMRTEDDFILKECVFDVDFSRIRD
jgi:hypothetical protein